MLVEKLERFFPVKVTQKEAVIFFFFKRKKERQLDSRCPWIRIPYPWTRMLGQLFCRPALHEQGVCGPVSSFLFK
jgi:hypothetical protein